MKRIRKEFVSEWLAAGMKVGAGSRPRARMPARGEGGEKGKEREEGGRYDRNG